VPERKPFLVQLVTKCSETLFREGEGGWRFRVIVTGPSRKDHRMETRPCAKGSVSETAATVNRFLKIILGAGWQRGGESPT